MLKKQRLNTSDENSENESTDIVENITSGISGTKFKDLPLKEGKYKNDEDDEDETDDDDEDYEENDDDDDDSENDEDDNNDDSDDDEDKECKKIDEISANLAGRYASKAVKDVHNRLTNRQGSVQKVKNRMTGINRANQRMEEESEVEEEVSKYQVQRKREPVRQMLQRQISTLKKRPPVKENVEEIKGLNNLMESEVSLSEDFKSKTRLIFETAVKTRIDEEVSRLEEAYETALAEELTNIQDDMAEKVNGYLNYVVENWMDENKIAIENGLRTEIAESFMSKLKNVFEDHYIEVPDSKVSLVDELAEKVEILEKSLNEAIQGNVKLNESISALKKEKIIKEQGEGLPLSDFEKLVKLAEKVEFSNTFESDVKTIKESYFQKERKSTVKANLGITEPAMISEDTNHQDLDNIKDHSIRSYVEAISRLKIK